MKTTNKTLYLTRGAIIAALYIALTYVASIFGLSSGVIQFRISEVLCILPLFFPEAIPGLYIGCLLSNILTGCVFWDVMFGSLATLIGCVGASLLIRLPHKLLWISTLPTIFANALIVPFVLMYAYGAEGSFVFFAATVFIGEAVCAGIGGSLLLYSLKSKKVFAFRKDKQ